MGCAMAQGFFLGEPVAAEDVGGLFAVPAAALPVPGGEAITALGDPSVAENQ
jgi:hypothetical protein